MFVRSFVLALGLSLAASAAFAQTPVELKVGDPAPDFSLQATGRQDLQAVGLQGQAGRGRRVVPEGLHAGLHHRVQVARGEGPPDQGLPGDLLHGQRRSARGEHQVRRRAQGRLPAAERSDEEDRRGVRRAQSDAASPTAGRSTSARTARFSTSTRPSSRRRRPKTWPRSLAKLDTLRQR